jgi:hypothetical protein
MYKQSKVFSANPAISYTHSVIANPANFLVVSPQIANLQIFMIKPQIHKFLRCASPLITNPQIFVGKNDVLGDFRNFKSAKKKDLQITNPKIGKKT